MATNTYFKCMDLDSPHTQNVTEIHLESPTTASPESPDSAAASSAPLAPRTASPKSGRHPVFKGIRCRSGKWVSEIREPKKTTRIWLGTYATAEMAAAAYDVATLALKGTEAAVNFPHLTSYYPIPASQAAGDIRAAAACAAAASGLIKCDGGGGVEAQIQFPPSDKGTDFALVNNSDSGERIESPVSSLETEALLIPNAPPPPPPALKIQTLLLPPETNNVIVEAASPVEEFVDEEELFEMPKLLEEMAEGMMMSPPRMKPASYDEEVEEGMAESFSVDDNLWSYSFLKGDYE